MGSADWAGMYREGYPTPPPFVNLASHHLRSPCQHPPRLHTHTHRRNLHRYPHPLHHNSSSLLQHTLFQSKLILGGFHLFLRTTHGPSEPLVS